MAETKTVVVNGNDRPHVEGQTVAELLRELGFGDQRVAVELNLEVVPRDRHAATSLSVGDRLEIVSFVGGG